MTEFSDAHLAEFSEYVSQLVRVCPEAAQGLVFPDPPPAISRRDRTTILRTLPDGAGIAAFQTAWLAFVAAHPDVVPDPSARYKPDFYNSRGEGKVVGPPPAPITADDYYRALVLSGESEEFARQVADDFAPDVDRPGVLWVGDTLLYVALLSPAHEERIRNYLGLDAARMTRELTRVREALAAQTPREMERRPEG